MSAYYNEIDPYAAQWLRNLIEAGHIAPGVVDERSIEDVRPSDLAGFTQCHFFAGVGVWSHALRSAGWADDVPVWTGSCPCQPFSSAGAGAGFEDPRHLWPTFAWLIKQCRPPIIFGEQVASKAVEPWVDLVHADMEAMEYAFGAVPFPSAGVGAPHMRDRLYWVGYANDSRSQGHAGDGRTAAWAGPSGSVAAAGVSLRVADANGEYKRPARDCEGLGSVGWGLETERMANPDGGNASSEREQCCGQQRQQQEDGGCRELAPRRLADTDGEDESRRRVQGPGESAGASIGTSCERPSGLREADPEQPGPTNGLWRAADWLFCRDGKWRPVESGTFPLADGVASRVGRLRAYGNAINAEAARIFIEAVTQSN